MLILKYKAKENIANNYRPTTCLPLAWKFLTGKFADEIYDDFENEMLLPEEWKGRRRKCKGTGDLLFVDKIILRAVQMRKKKLALHGLIIRKHMIWFHTTGS